MATYDEFVARVRRELEESSSSTWSDQSLLDWTNDALFDFGTRVKYGFDEEYSDSVAMQESYEMPHQTVEVVRVAYDGHFLKRMSESDYFPRSLSIGANPGTPEVYAVLENVLYLNPTPAESGKQIRVWRRFRPAPITAGTDLMPFNDEYNDAISYFVKARAWEQVGDFDSAKLNDSLYQREVDDATWHQLEDSVGDYYHEPKVVW